VDIIFENPASFLRDKFNMICYKHTTPSLGLTEGFSQTLGRIACLSKMVLSIMSSNLVVLR